MFLTSRVTRRIIVGKEMQAVLFASVGNTRNAIKKKPPSVAHESCIISIAPLSALIEAVMASSPSGDHFTYSLMIDDCFT